MKARTMVGIIVAMGILTGCSNVYMQGAGRQQELLFCRQNDGKPLTQDQFAQDISACFDQSKVFERSYTQDKEDEVVFNDPLFRKCMEARGYLYFMTEPRKRIEGR